MAPTSKAPTTEQPSQAPATPVPTVPPTEDRLKCTLRKGYACVASWMGQPWAASSVAACERMCEARTVTYGEAYRKQGMGCEYESKTETCGITAQCTLTKVASERAFAAMCEDEHPMLLPDGTVVR